MRSKADDLIHFVLETALGIIVTVGGRPRELIWRRGIKRNDSVVRPSLPTVPSANIAGGVSNPTDRPAALDGNTFVDNAELGRLATAILSLPVLASARN